MSRPSVRERRSYIAAQPKYDEHIVKSATRVIQILEFFDDIQRPAHVMEVADALGFPQSSTSALLRSLVTVGYLSYSYNSRLYTPSSRVALLGSWVDSRVFADGNVLSMMKEIGRQTGETVLLATRNGLNVQYVHVIQATSPTRLRIPVGSVRSLVHSGAGYALLSTMRDVDIRRIVLRINAEATAGQPTINHKELLEIIAEVRERSYAFTTGLGTVGGGILVKPLPVLGGKQPFVVGLGGHGDAMRRRLDQLIAIFEAAYRRYIDANREIEFPSLEI
jgi:DNA-binding IclR family transcriptional regulator